MFVTYDSQTRRLTSTSDVSDQAAERENLKKEGKPWTEVEAMPGFMGDCYVDPDGFVRLAEPMPLPDDFGGDRVFDAVTPMPDVPGLPDHAIISPAPGTLLQSGTTYVIIEAVGYVPVYRNYTVITDEDRAARLVAYARNARWEREQAGAPFKGMRLATDDRCKLMLQSSITGVDLLVKAGVVTVENWQTNWTFLDGKQAVKRADLDQMTVTLMVYVSGLFAACDAVEAAVADKRVTSEQEVDALFSSILGQ